MTRALKTFTEYRISWIDSDDEVIDLDHYDTRAEARKAVRPMDGAVSWMIQKVIRKAYADDRAAGGIAWDIDSEIEIDGGSF